MKYLIGADPELFLVDSKGNFRSAHTIVKGTKHDPFPVLNGFVQVDGVAAEFNINPAKTADEFHGNIRDVLSELSERVSEEGYSLRVIPTATFDKQYFRRLPPYAKLLGCSADYSVYSGTANPPPATKEPFRTGAGHIHVGWTENANPAEDAHMFDCQEAVRQLDSVLYFSSLLWDSDTKRRELYGKMGSFRPKTYGVEYRPLSNVWVGDPDLHHWIFDATVRSMELLDDDVKIYADYVSRGAIADINEGKELSKLRLLEYHDYLVQQYNIPELPSSYTRVHS